MFGASRRAGRRRGGAGGHPTVRVGHDRRAWGAGVAGALLVGLAGSTVVRIQRIRRTAARHAHDLDTSGTVGEGLGEPVRLVVLGDSAARGFGLPEASSAFPQQVARRLAAATGRRVAVGSHATDGHRTADVLAEQVPLLRADAPDAVVVSVGVNDVVGRTPRGVLATATEQLLRGVEAAADGAVVVFVPCPDLGAAPGFGRALGTVVGWRCRRVAAIQLAVAGRLGVATVPLPRPDATMFGVDGFHPGASGHAAMAAGVADALVDRAADVLASPEPA